MTRPTTNPTTTPTGLELRDPDLPPFTGCHRTDDECSWGPLERLALISAAAGHPFHPHAFMFMGTIPGPAGTTIHAYKHSDTRRYVHVDAAGHTYRYGYDTTRPKGGPSGGPGIYTPHRSPAQAITEAYR